MPVLHASPRSRSRRVSLQFLFPLPYVRFFSTFVSHESASGLSHLWFSPFTHTSTVWSSGTVAFSPPKRCGCVFPSFPRCFSPLSLVRFLPPRFDRISPALQTGSIVPLPPFGFRFPFLLSDSGSPSSFRIPAPLPPFGFQLPFLLSDSSSTTPSLGFGSVARGLRRSAPHTTPLKRQLWSVRGRRLNVSLNEVLWTGNRGWGMLISSAFRTGHQLFLNILKRSLSA